MAPLQMFPRDTHAAVDLRAHRENDLMVMLLQIVELHIRAELDIAVIAKSWVRRDAVIGLRDRFDLLVVGRDPAAHEPERRRQPVVEIDLDRIVFLLEQMLRCVKARRPRPDDRYTKRMVVCTHWHRKYGSDL